MNEPKPELWRRDYVDGQVDSIKTNDLIVYAAVHPETGEVDLGSVVEFDDELTELAVGWEWQKFRLFPELLWLRWK